MEVRVGKRDGLGRPDFGLGNPDGRGRPEILGFEAGRSFDIDLSLGFVMIAVFSFRSTVLSKTGRFPFVMVPVRETVRFGFSNVALGSIEGPSPASVGIIEKSKSSSFRLSVCGVDCFPISKGCDRTGEAWAALTRVGEIE